MRTKKKKKEKQNDEEEEEEEKKSAFSFGSAERMDGWIRFHRPEWG